MCETESNKKLTIEQRIEKIELQIECEQEQRRLIWSYLNQLTEYYNKLSESLGVNPISLPDPSQKKLKRYDDGSKSI